MRAIVTSVVGAALAFHISRVAYQQGGLFAWHPVCMSLGALFISTVSIHAVRSKRSVNGIKPKTARVQLHSALSDLALISMIGGTYAIYANKERMGKPHWMSWHAWAGLLTLALWVMNLAIAGANTADFKKGRVWFLWNSRTHRWLGGAGYATGLVTVCLGLHSGWGLRSLGGESFAWGLTAVVGAIFVGVIFQSQGGKTSAKATRKSA